MMKIRNLYPYWQCVFNNKQDFISLKESHGDSWEVLFRVSPLSMLDNTKY